MMNMVGSIAVFGVLNYWVSSWSWRWVSRRHWCVNTYIQPAGNNVSLHYGNVW